MVRLTAVLGLLGLLAWCCLLFGIGLDDLTNRNSDPGVIFSVVVLPLLIVALVYAILRLVDRRLVRRILRRQ